MSKEPGWTLKERWLLSTSLWRSAWNDRVNSVDVKPGFGEICFPLASVSCPYGSTVRQSSRRLESKVWWSRRRRTRRGGCCDRLQHGEGADGSAEGDVYEADDERRWDCFYEEWQMGAEPASWGFQQRILTFVGALCTNSQTAAFTPTVLRLSWIRGGLREDCKGVLKL